MRKQSCLRRNGAVETRDERKGASLTIEKFKISAFFALLERYASSTLILTRADDFQSNGHMP
ncbi:hypothetical protein [Brevundimonas pondensis]|uniref:Uncharacterized protein n=1 Tax=Brevundimonas pondensis TaxID=2774189 RepID=A0ABX7SGK9_9CAUL|nr:hypothetical protein [Brevundimonas pondensis]QTC86707.1 hypothetical protein IFE19_11200 [Brevundimonas pondensis]